MNCPVVPRRGAGLQAAAERGSGPGLVPEPASQVAQEGTAPQDWRTLLRHLVYVPRPRPRPRPRPTTPRSLCSHFSRSVLEHGRLPSATLLPALPGPPARCLRGDRSESGSRGLVLALRYSSLPPGKAACCRQHVTIYRGLYQCEKFACEGLKLLSSSLMLSCKSHYNNQGP